MPIIDKPVCELEQYMGVNPRPEDFEEYWEQEEAYPLSGLRS